MDSEIPYLKSWTHSLSHCGINLSQLWHLSHANRATETHECGRYLLFLFLLFGIGGVIFFYYQPSSLSFLLVTEYHFSFRKTIPDLMLSPHALGNPNLGSKDVHVTQISPIRTRHCPDLIIHPNKRRTKNSDQWKSDHGFCQAERNTLFIGLEPRRICAWSY